MEKKNTMTAHQVAPICHEANRAYCAALGDTSQPTWEEAPHWQRESAVKGVEFHLASLRADKEPTPSASHDSWLDQKRSEGWQYGPIKNPELKLHPCFLPYEGLPIEQQAKDYIFAGIVTACYRAGVVS